MKYNFYEKVYSDGNTYYHLQLAPMSDEEYDKLKPIIESLGGHWREKYKCFVFGEDIREKITEIQTKNQKISAEYIIREHHQFYPTPKSVAKRVVELANIQSGQLVLEPSAGEGALVDCINTDCAVLCIEPNEASANVLTQKGYVTAMITFEDYYDPTIQYDRIIMNPPYSKQKDVKHVKMAYDMLKTGGILVAVISENALYYQTQLSEDFRKFLKDTKAIIETVPPRAFTESGTTIETVIVKINKT